MKQLPQLIQRSLIVFSVFASSAFVSFWATSNGGLFKSTPYIMRDATSDAVLNTLTNGAGAGVLDGVIAKVKAKAELKGGTPVDNTLYTAYIDTYLSQVDQLDNTTRAQLGPDYAFIFKYIYPRVYELRKSGSQFGTIVDSLETLVNTGSIDTANIQPQLTINRSITADGQTLSWNSQNAQTISWLSTGPNGNKTGTNLPLNPAPFFTSAAGLYDQGWLAGTYTVVWTVTGNSTTKTFNETFTIPPYTPSASTTTPSGTFTLGQNDVIAIPSGGRYTFDNSKGNVTASWDIQNAEGCWLDPGYVKNGMAYTTKTNGGDFLPAKGNEVIPILAPDGGKFYDIKLVCGKQSTGWANSYGQPTKAFFIDMVTNAVTCTSWTYSAFGTCQSGNTQTRTVTSSSPSGCTGGSPVLSQACTYAEPTCAGTHPPEWNGVKLSGYTLVGMVGTVMNSTWKYTEPNTYSCVWSCEAWYARNGDAGCSPIQNTCTSWTYSAFGSCQSDNTQTRTVTSSSPSGCTGGSPVLSQACTYVPITCSGTRPQLGNGISIVEYNASPFTTWPTTPGPSNETWQYGANSCGWTCAFPNIQDGDKGCKIPTPGSGIQLTVLDAATGQGLSGVAVWVGTAGMNVGRTIGNYTTDASWKIPEYWPLPVGGGAWSSIQLTQNGYKIRSAEGCTADTRVHGGKQVNFCVNISGNKVTITLVKWDISTTPRSVYNKSTYSIGDTLTGYIEGGNPNDTWACIDIPGATNCTSGGSAVWRQLTKPYDGHQDEWQIVSTGEGDRIELNSGMVIAQSFPTGVYTVYVKTGQWGTATATTFTVNP